MRLTTMALVALITAAGCNEHSPLATGQKSQPAPGSDAEHVAAPKLTVPPQRPSSPTEWITFDTGSLAGRCWITSSNGYLKEHANGSPGVGVFFGTITRPDRPTEFLYLVLCKYAGKASLGDVGNRQSTTSSGYVSIIDGLLASGTAARLGVHLNVDPESGKCTREEYSLNDQRIDLSPGRLLLVDLTVSPANVGQVNVELPQRMPREIDRETVRRLAENEVPALQIKHRAVADFFK